MGGRPLGRKGNGERVYSRRDLVVLYLAVLSDGRINRSPWLLVAGVGTNRMGQEIEAHNHQEWIHDNLCQYFEDVLRVVLMMNRPRTNPDKNQQRPQQDNHHCNETSCQVLWLRGI